MKPTSLVRAPALASFSLLCGTAAADDLQLPDPLADSSGKPVASAEAWEREVRPLTLEKFREHVYGRDAVGKPADLKWTRKILEVTGISEQVIEGQVTFSGPGGAGKIRVMLVIPAAAKEAVPLFLLINNRGPELADLSQPNGFWPALEIARRGFATAIFQVADVDPDQNEGFQDGVHALFDKPPRGPDAWGTIAAWAWGASRVIDALEKEPAINARRIAVVGHSRGGKTALWCGAQDPRVALTVSNNSGCTGAALARRKQGEQLADINRNFPHWFCENYKRYNGKEETLPVDQHQLVGLIAPRLAYVASAAADAWADPEGEFLACVHAGPVYRLHGLTGLEADTMPPPGGKLHSGSIGYHLRPGKHDLTLADWQHFMDFAGLHWK
jgi:pimeloyl-ACP methyl ester carboxylesterase